METGCYVEEESREMGQEIHGSYAGFLSNQAEGKGREVNPIYLLPVVPG